MEGTDPNVIPKQRHGCLTAWLILMIIFGVLGAIGAFAGNFLQDFIMQNNPDAAAQMGEIPQTNPFLAAILSLMSVVVAVFLFQWKKWAFWLYLGVAALSFIVNAVSLGVGMALMGLVGGAIGVGILYGVLQIKQGGLSGWQNLE